jgi:outer membrane biosynthesis protein TonB
MKTRIATLTILLGLFISTTAFANQPVPASKAVASSVANYIEDEMEYPEFAINEKFQGDVVIRIVIEEDGTFDVTEANSQNNSMINYVVREVEKLDSEDFDKYAGQTVLVKLTFDLKMF